ncbi:MAG: hypothetical protein EBR40_11860, partial [Proteobacteria bacterium]|nr:hypothetical protein [Pseudomonadota bacterium]
LSSVFKSCGLSQCRPKSQCAVADGEDPHARIKEFFERFERALPSFRTYTLDHPEHDDAKFLHDTLIRRI